MAEPLVKGRLEAGTPQLGQVFNDTVAEFGADLAPYALAGLGQLVVVLPVVLVAAMVAYMGGIMAFMVGSFGSIVGGAMVGSVAGEELGVLATLFLSLATMVLTVVAIVAVVGGIAALLAPFNAGLVRAVAAHQRGEEVLDFGSAFRHMAKDVPAVLMAALIQTTLVMVGLCMCYLPALIVPIVFGFATTLVALSGRGAVDAFQTCIVEVRKDPSFHLTYGLVHFGMNMIAGYVPVVGPMFSLAVHVRVHRSLFGDPVDSV